MPPPWSVPLPYMVRQGYHRLEITNSFPAVVAAMSTGRADTDKATAEMMVHRVNSYPNLLAACEALFGHVETGDLVRNTEFDTDPSWSMTALKLVRSLQSAEAAIAKSKGDA